LRCRLVDPAEVRELEPELTGHLAGASFFPDDVQCAPRPITRALVREARAAGTQIRTHCEVKAIAVDGGRVTGVRLADGSLVEAAAVVLAAGPWSRRLAESAGLDLPLEPRWGQLALLSARHDR